MALAKEDLEQIQVLIKQTIAETPEVGNANVRYELDLRERTIRVEAELKHQRELMLAGFAQMDKRFTQSQEESNKRFEQIDKRFEQIDKRFEQIDKRFEQIDKRFEQVDKRFELILEESNKRFEQIERRFEQVERRFEQIDKRFEQVDKRFEQVDRQFEKLEHSILDIHQEIKLQMRWSFGILLGVGGLVVGVLKLMQH